jgi:hypothetical protein
MTPQLSARSRQAGHRHPPWFGQGRGKFRRFNRASFTASPTPPPSTTFPRDKAKPLASSALMYGHLERVRGDHHVEKGGAAGNTCLNQDLQQVGCASCHESVLSRSRVTG